MRIGERERKKNLNFRTENYVIVVPDILKLSKIVLDILKPRLDPSNLPYRKFDVPMFRVFFAIELCT